MKIQVATGALLFFGFVFVANALAFGELTGFQEIKSDHFKAQFLVPEDQELAQKALDRAEYYYDRIARDIGFSRYQGYWTWEKRAGIIIFPDQISFSKFTGQPDWSVGYATRESKFYHDRTIVSYSGQLNFLDEVLPHELAHLMLWDYFDQHIGVVPVWLEEGIAQLEEADKRGLAREALIPVVQAGNHIPFTVLGDLRPLDLKDNGKVAVFYAQSLSLVVFLIEKYGQESFYRLCKEMRDGQTFDTALARSYGGIFNSMADVERRWVEYILGQ
ncbi:MAG: hypothetical protein HQL18_00015 [Candidatus Omnitrophica bacterium]|nr:hypothetical protein [Candidatus Omnitrophota bacterium]